MKINLHLKFLRLSRLISDEEKLADAVAINERLP